MGSGSIVVKKNKQERLLWGSFLANMKSLKIILLVLLPWTLNLVSVVQAQTPANLSLQVSNGLVRLNISGTASNACTVQFSTNLTKLNPWQYRTNFRLTNAATSFVDTNQPLPSSLFYRVFTQALPTNVVPITNMIWVSPGGFTMGSPTNEVLRSGDETQHTVTLTRGFYMGKYVVTQGAYQALIATNPSYFSPANGYVQNLQLPVEQVSWSDATNYCARLTEQEVLAGRLPTGWAYRLPTESEWEYAGRAGTPTAFYYGNALQSGKANFDGRYEYDSSVGTISNLTGINLSRTSSVGSYEANAWGFSDMCGNVFEWCSDWYGSYPGGNVSDPQGPATGTFHIIRGGGFSYQGVYCRSAQRGNASGFINYLGFRVVLAFN